MKNKFIRIKKHGRVGGNQSTKTFGGYSAANTVHEDFVIKIPKGMDLEKTSPILCAGITMYSPLKHWGAAGTEKKTVGIVGIGTFKRLLKIASQWHYIQINFLNF